MSEFIKNIGVGAVAMLVFAIVCIFFAYLLQLMSPESIVYVLAVVAFVLFSSMIGSLIRSAHEYAQEKKENQRKIANRLQTLVEREASDKQR